MVIKRSWKVVSGTMAAGIVMVPQAAALADDGDTLEDPVPVIEDWQFSENEKAFLKQFFEGQVINLDFLSLTFSADSFSIQSEPSESVESELSESVQSEPSESVESELSESVQSEPSAEESGSFGESVESF